ncbi:winged helix-turn-helix domain-containing protein [Luteimonas sp. RC10]|uniref:winged helix-turn-helix domain-containing protein n=1 Tax=Luteimonas sp. RC10 TaxID=2587035 RepID=UPI00160B0457|nr:winged helix-turn-helix domain-containing protein [Luteimonas sp. RC10]MBB3343445.1 DNA-binding winged helix-turn-helix (wHTH) protein [Luteimonas sp. RC10]
MLRFDAFGLDPATLQIFRGEQPLDTPPQAVEVLAYLIECRDRVVPRRELLDRFWPRAGTGGDAALNTCIRRIRALLDDDADAPRYIQTRPRAGYRFIGTLAGDAQGAVASPPPRRHRQLGLASGVLAAVMLAVGGASWGYRALALAPPPHRIAVEPVQGLCEYVMFPQFNAGLRESLVAQLSGSLPTGYYMATEGAPADLHARVSVRQTSQQTVAVVTLVDDAGGHLVWSGEFAADTDTEDYVPLQRALAAQMATGLVRALE